MVFKHFDPNYKTMHRSKVSYIWGGGRGSGIRAYNVHNKSKNMPRSPLIIPLDPLPRENYVELKEGVNIYHFTLDQRIGYFLSIFFY